MNPWDIILVILGWSLLVSIVGVLALVVFGVITGLLTEIKKRFIKKGHKDTEVTRALLDSYLAEVTETGVRMYGNSPNPSLEAFRHGARVGWSVLIKK